MKLSAGLGVIAKRLIVVAGPTAVGKSEFALSLAQALSGEVVSLDSVAVFRGLDIGTAKPSASARSLVPHHLIDVLEPNEPINVARFVALACDAIADIEARGKVAVVVGGSTMYLTALLYGLAALGPSQGDLRSELSSVSTAELYAQLSRRDPARAAVLHPNDRLRIERAVESAHYSDQVPSERIAEHGNRDLRYAALCFCICLNRSELYARINRRVKQMLELGLVAEVRQIVEQFGPDCPGLKAIGYAEVLQMFSQQPDLGDLEKTIAQNTRRFAKRQLTYWRNEPLKRNWKIDPPQVWPSGGGGKTVFPDFEAPKQDFEKLVKQAKEFLMRLELEVDVKYTHAL